MSSSSSATSPPAAEKRARAEDEAGADDAPAVKLAKREDYHKWVSEKVRREVERDLKAVLTSEKTAVPLNADVVEHVMEIAGEPELPVLMSAKKARLQVELALVPEIEKWNARVAA